MNAEDKVILDELFSETEQQVILTWICENIKDHIWDDIRTSIASDSYKFNRNAIVGEIETQLRKAKIITPQKTTTDIKGLNLFFEGLDELDIVNESISDIYDSYVEVCKQNKKPHLSKKLFGAEIRKRFDLNVRVTTRDGKSVRIYTR